jgi:hypothetical protein
VPLQASANLIVHLAVLHHLETLARAICHFPIPIKPFTCVELSVPTPLLELHGYRLAVTKLTASQPLRDGGHSAA